MDQAQVVRWQRHGLEPAQACALFDRLAPVAPHAMQGTWQGRSLKTGHPLDGVLDGLGWYGKRFEPSGKAHPLLFRDRRGRIIALEPALMPLVLVRRWPGLGRHRLARWLFSRLMPLCRARAPGAQLSRVTFRGVASAAMVYDRLPITDHFRDLDGNRVLGWMDLEDAPQPFFFTLERAPAPMESA